MSKAGAYGLPRYPTKKQRKSRKRKWKLALLITLLILALLFVYFQRNVTRVLISISEATMRASTTIAVNDAVFYTLSDKMQYEDLVNITRNEQGDIVAVSANVARVYAKYLKLTVHVVGTISVKG